MKVITFSYTLNDITRKHNQYDCIQTAQFQCRVRRFLYRALRVVCVFFLYMIGIEAGSALFSTSLQQHQEAAIDLSVIF